MRKHNKKFAERFGRTDGDRTNSPQQMAHQLANSKSFQLAANSLLRNLFKRVGV